MIKHAAIAATQVRPAPLLAMAPAALVCAALALALGGCTDPTKAKHEKIVRCTGFSIALASTDDGSTTRADAESLLNKDGITEKDTIPIGAAAKRYSTQMDPARVSKLSRDGATDANDLLTKKDAPGIADYIKGCVSTFKTLGE